MLLNVWFLVVQKTKSGVPIYIPIIIMSQKFHCLYTSKDLGEKKKPNVLHNIIKPMFIQEVLLWLCNINATLPTLSFRQNVVWRVRGSAEYQVQRHKMNQRNNDLGSFRVGGPPQFRYMAPKFSYTYTQTMPCFVNWAYVNLTANELFRKSPKKEFRTRYVTINFSVARKRYQPEMFIFDWVAFRKCDGNI